MAMASGKAFKNIIPNCCLIQVGLPIRQDHIYFLMGGGGGVNRVYFGC
jgi:hypothetical protein